MKYFLNDEKIEYSIDEPIHGELENVLTEFYELTEDDGSFLGLENDDGKILQFAWEGDDKWLVDIPYSESMTTLQKFASYDECVQIIKDVFRGQRFEDIEGLVKYQM